MALTISKFIESGMADVRVVFVEITFNGTYTTNGESLVPGDVGMVAIHMAIFEPIGGKAFEYDHTNEKLKVYYYDYNAGADGSAIEHPASDTSVTALKGMFIGH